VPLPLSALESDIAVDTSERSVTPSSVLKTVNFHSEDNIGRRFTASSFGFFIVSWQASHTKETILLSLRSVQFFFGIFFERRSLLKLSEAAAGRHTVTFAPLVLRQISCFAASPFRHLVFSVQRRWRRRCRRCLRLRRRPPSSASSASATKTLSRLSVLPLLPASPFLAQSGLPP
jgi:hypothetical protein